jgi:2-keto-4-pentenoate hydratase/2-oxohepta-3-ene-1,7-dioic acid hydratase in catechol pathway
MRLARVRVDGGAPVFAAEHDGKLRRLAPDGACDPDGERLDGERLAPVTPGKIVAIGLNYLDHIRDCGAEPPARPLVFAKFPSSVIGPDAPIVIDAEVTERVDWDAPGDVVECEIDGIGTLRNPVIAG